jgi:hypothetical protein
MLIFIGAPLSAGSVFKRLSLGDRIGTTQIAWVDRRWKRCVCWTVDDSSALGKELRDELPAAQAKRLLQLVNFACRKRGRSEVLQERFRELRFGLGWVVFAAKVDLALPKLAEGLDRWAGIANRDPSGRAKGLSGAPGYAGEIKGGWPR